MTPKEKAIELVSQYQRLGLMELMRSTENGTFGILSKQCALIAVDEIMYQLLNRRQVYWQQVRKEIEAL
jgi:hypothetical protein